MNFEKLQKSWQRQPVDLLEKTPAALEQLMESWRKQQRSIRRTNILTTLGFAAVVIDFGFVYSSFHAGRTPLFGGSLAFMTLLMLVYLWIMWRGTAYRKENTDVPSREFIAYSVEKLLWRRKTITTYTWVYTILLWMALMLYFMDVLREASRTIQVWAPICTTLFAFGMRITIKYTKEKRQLRSLDELIDRLRRLSRQME